MADRYELVFEASGVVTETPRTDEEELLESKDDDQ